ncbi:immunoglobulin-like domain-containing protein [Fictibacillus sp. Mic-4]|uniref:immunoglobulin-like domain-containing protein n=1 Tax=Fictibacillus sp. Mic-4 TaxID=3132826 RepID=UPI003CEDC7AA
MRKFAYFSLVLLISITMFGCANKEKKTETLMKRSEFGHLPNRVKTKAATFEIKMEKASYPSSVKEIAVMIKNYGPDIVFGTSYQVEKYINGSWYAIPFKKDVGFTEIAIILKTNDTYRQKVGADLLDYRLTEGKYRIVKEFSVGNNEKLNLAAEFKISKN